MGGEGNFQSKDLTKGVLGVIIIGFGVSMALINFGIRQNNRKSNPNR
jgi:multisubunit Na+/H+ antiporter MnhC subunit